MEKATFLVIVPKRPRPSLATSAARKVTFLAIALSPAAAVAVAASPAPRSVTAAARPATSLARALRAQVALVVDTALSAVAAVAATGAKRLAIPAVV